MNTAHCKLITFCIMFFYDQILSQFYLVAGAAWPSCISLLCLWKEAAVNITLRLWNQSALNLLTIK